MRPTPLYAVIFDFDGTLASLCIDFDRMRRNVAAIAAAHLPAVPSPDGQPVLEWIDSLAAVLENGDAGRPRPGGAERVRAFRNACAAVIQDMEVAAARCGGLFAFTRPILRRLAARGVRTGIITRNCGPAVRAVFPDADARCGCVLTREDAPLVKPHPEHLHQALRRLGVPPRHALMVGDHPMDIRTAQRAGVRAAGVASGRISTLTLLQAGADLVARDCNELLQALDRCGLLPRP